MDGSVKYSVGDLLLDTECPVCFDIPKEPKTLPCFHTFCLKCLQDFCAKFSAGTSVSCPMCRAEFVVPPGGVETLRCHPTVSRILELEGARLDKESENSAAIEKPETTPIDDVMDDDLENVFEFVELSENLNEFDVTGMSTSDGAVLDDMKNLDYSSLVKRAALGRYATFGDLYDATTDTFIGTSILRDDMKERSRIRPVDSEGRNWSVKVLDPNNIEERRTQLDICREMELSVLTGLVQPRGHAEYLSKRIWNTMDNNKIYGALVCTMITAERGIDVSAATVRRWMSLRNDTDVESSTHVVVGVECGVRIVISLTTDLRDGESTEIQKAEFSRNLREFAKVIERLDESTDISETQMSSLLETVHAYEFSLLVDVNFDNLSGFTKLDEMVAFMKRMHSFQSAFSDGMCFPLKYTFLPLSTVATYFQVNLFMEKYECMLNNDSSGITAELISLMDKLENLRKLCTKFQNQFEENTLYLPEGMLEEIDKIANTIKIVARWKECVKGNLVNVRSGKGQLKILSDYNQIARTHLWAESLSEFLSKSTETTERISILRRLEENGAFFVGKDTNVSDIRHKFELTEYYVFFFKYSRTSATFLQNHALFLLLLDPASYNTGSLELDPRSAAMAKKRTQMRGIVVDTDLCPNQQQKENLPNGTRICQYSSGVYILHDVMNEILNGERRSVAKSMVALTKMGTRPLRYAYAEWRCPKSLDGLCPQDSKRWLCDECSEILEYDFESKTIYCSCGSAPYFEFVYQCSSEQHGSDFAPFRPSVPEDIIKNLEPIKCKNILILGETGVGKSTWINGIVNYATFPSLDEASKSEQVYVIPTSFTVLDEDADVDKKICVGNSEHEHFATEGQSSTQEPNAYRFMYADKHIRLIDTPGIGDTRGIEQDKINFDKIMTYLSQIDELHGICILLKPNNPKLTVCFRFCLTELLTHLHVDATKNIVFCFTNSRASFYTPGDTRVPLRHYLSAVKEKQSVDISLSKENMYCFDNESFRYLCTLHSGVPLPKLQISSYQGSWKQSVSETNRLLDNISNREAHKLINTVSLNATRNIIIKLTEPLADISLNIENNIKAIERQMEKIKTYDEEEENLNSKLMIKVTDLVARDVEYPRMVCTNINCTSTKTSPITGLKQTIYESICHSPCNLSGVEAKKYPNPMLLRCAIINKDNLKCEECGCDWTCHMHITYVYDQVEQDIPDTTVKQMIQSGVDNKKAIKAAVESGQEKKKALEVELESIARCSAKFGAFLKVNSIVPYNDAFDEYIQYLIGVEKPIASMDGDRSKVENLETMRKVYQQQVKIIKDALPNESKSPINIDEVYKLKEELEQLPHNGLQLKQILDVAAVASAKHKLRNETFYNVKATAYEKTQGEKKVKIVQRLRYSFKEKLLQNRHAYSRPTGSESVIENNGSGMSKP